MYSNNGMFQPFHVESMWSPCGVHVESIWNGWSPCGVYMEWMESTWSLYGMDGVHVESMWSPCGIHMESILIPCGIHVDIPSFHMEFGHSIIIPCGIQVEWRPQNEWNHSQNIFHGVHMESMWNDVDSM